jgi:short-subunit dehydrogenase
MNTSKPMNIFITGASSGLGSAMAFEYAKRYSNNNKNYTRENHASASLMDTGSQGSSINDINIGLVGRDSERLQKLAAALQNQYKITCAIYALDVRDATALEAAAADFMQQHGTPDIVIANAGVSRGTLTADKTDFKAIQAIFDINVMGLVYTFQPFIEAMKVAGAQGKTAQLVGVASVAGIRGIPGSGAYSASKAAVISYCESLRTEMQHFNIAVSTIAPGYIRTPMTDLNPYKMPFLMDADIFAHKFANAVEAKVRFKIIPWQMGVVARLMRLIPPVLWDWVMKNAPHKKRLDWDWL